MSPTITKTILVLANSIKKSGRCVAGRELIPCENGKQRIGPWIRPIDPLGDEGTIDQEMAKIAGKFINPLDVIKIEFTGDAGNANHPEDWNVERTVPWKRVNSLNPSVLDKMDDDSGDLWGVVSARSRKVAPRAGMQTLRLIKPTGNLEVEAFLETTSWGPKFRCYLKIAHRGVNHLFSIDDPLFSWRHRSVIGRNQVGEKRVTFPLDPARTVVVASLTPPLKGNHYKIAATIFEL
jgi:hypothetical protein